MVLVHLEVRDESTGVVLFKDSNVDVPAIAIVDGLWQRNRPAVPRRFFTHLDEAELDKMFTYFANRVGPRLAKMGIRLDVGIPSMTKYNMANRKLTVWYETYER